MTREGRPLWRLTLIWVAVVIGVVLVGTGGYVFLTGWSLEDALYMTVITLATVSDRRPSSMQHLRQANRPQR